MKKSITTIDDCSFSYSYFDFLGNAAQTTTVDKVQAARATTAPELLKR